MEQALPSDCIRKIYRLTWFIRRLRIVRLFLSFENEMQELLGFQMEIIQILDNYFMQSKILMDKEKQNTSKIKYWKHTGVRWGSMVIEIYIEKKNCKKFWTPYDESGWCPSTSTISCYATAGPELAFPNTRSITECLSTVVCMCTYFFPHWLCQCLLSSVEKLQP